MSKVHGAPLGNILLFIGVLICGPLKGAPLVGYHILPFYPGDNLFHNVLDDPYGNNIAWLFRWGDSTRAIGTSISVWDPRKNAFGPTSVWQEGRWSVDLVLPVGVGARLTTSQGFTHVFQGVVLNHDGSTVIEPELYPRPFRGPAGTYLLGDKFMVGFGDPFMRVLGRAPEPGEQLIRLNPLTQTFTTNTYSFAGWEIEPALGIGEAAFFVLLDPATLPPPPVLSIALVSRTQVELSWDATAPNYFLQRATGRTSTWEAFPGAPTFFGTRLKVLTALDGGDRFFRLQRYSSADPAR